jgi:hypothetical protein
MGRVEENRRLVDGWTDSSTLSSSRLGQNQITQRRELLKLVYLFMRFLPLCDFFSVGSCGALVGEVQVNTSRLI